MKKAMSKKEMKKKEMVFPIMPGTATKTKKRSTDMVRKRDVKSFYDDELPRNIDVDPSFVESMTNEELRLDVDALDEVLDPGEGGNAFYQYPQDHKEKFFKCVDDIGEVKDRVVDKETKTYLKSVQNQSPETIPIMVKSGHAHPEMRLTKEVRDKIPSILRSKEGPEQVAMDDRECYNVVTLPRYNEFENYISPLLVMRKLKRKKIEWKFSDLDEETRRVIGIRATVIEFILEKEHGLKDIKTLVTACYNMDHRGAFYLCLVMKLDRLPEIWSKRSFVNVQNVLLEEEKKSIFDMDLVYFRHFYFGCGCYNKPT